MKNIQEIELQRNNLLARLNNKYSSRSRLLLLSDFFNELFETDNNLIIHSYTIEFIDNYISLLVEFMPFYIPIEITYRLLEQIDKLISLKFLGDYHQELEKAKLTLIDKLDDLEKVLAGQTEHLNHNTLFFPVLEKEITKDEQKCSGILDTITIDIKPSNKDVFILIPSETEIEERLHNQVKISWEVALNNVRTKKRKIQKYHKVIIQFDKRAGFYIGESLGTTLTIGFIEKLLQFYNTPYLVNINNNIALTGGINNSGEILPVSPEIIKQKVVTVFYSGINIFVIPKEDETAALEKLKKLKIQYPNRNLKIIAIENIYDLLDRRILVEIKKQNAVVRTAKAAKKNYITVVLLFLLIFLATYYAIRDFDDNPAMLRNNENTLFVENKSGKILWSKSKYFDRDYLSNPYVAKREQLIVDINNDGVNEIIVCGENTTALQDKRKEGRVVCFNNEGKELWDYVFKDTISSPLEVLQPSYFIRIIDTLTLGKRRVLFLSCSNGPSYSSAIFKLDLETGNRLDGTLWHSGHICGGLITDCNNDGKKDLVFIACNNGYEKLAIAGTTIKEWDATSPSTFKYIFYNKKLENFIFYIMTPNTDYSKYYNQRGSGLKPILINYEKEKCYFYLTQENGGGSDGLHYKLDYNLKDFRIVVGSHFRVLRDTLVAHGKLKPPLTDTPEYCELLKSQILYWNGKKFVRREELD